MKVNMVTYGDFSRSANVSRLSRVLEEVQTQVVEMPGICRHQLSIGMRRLFGVKDAYRLARES